MTPQEKDLITQLLGRLPAANEPRAAEADALSRSAVAQRPDAPYFLVQTVLIQEMALAEAQKHIEELNQQLAAKEAPAAPTSFLGRAFSNAAAPPPPPNTGPWGAAPSGAQPSSVWSQSSGGSPAPAQQMPPPPGVAPGIAMPWGGGGGGFLRQAATTAAGVAGGALLFQGIQSLFGPHYGNVLGGMPMQPGISETVINNYYDGSAPASDTRGSDYQSSDYRQADYDQGSSGADYASDDSGGNDDGGSYDV